MNLRIGIHIGDVIEQGEDIFGDGVNIASRIQSLADSGGICISQAVNDSIQSQSDIRAISIGNRELKGIEGKQEIFSLMVKDAPVLNENEVEALKDARKEGDKFNARPFLSWIAGTIFFNSYIIPSGKSLYKNTDHGNFKHYSCFSIR